MKTSQAHVVISIDKTLFTFVYERSIYNVASDVTSYESYVKTVVRSIKGQRSQTSEKQSLLDTPFTANVCKQSQKGFQGNKNGGQVLIIF